MERSSERFALYQFAFKMDDPAVGRVPGRTQEYVEESDAATTKVYA